MPGVALPRCAIHGRRVRGSGAPRAALRSSARRAGAEAACTSQCERDALTLRCRPRRFCFTQDLPELVFPLVAVPWTLPWASLVWQDRRTVECAGCARWGSPAPTRDDSPASSTRLRRCPHVGMLPARWHRGLGTRGRDAPDNPRPHCPPRAPPALSCTPCPMPPWGGRGWHRPCTGLGIPDVGMTTTISRASLHPKRSACMACAGSAVSSGPWQDEGRAEDRQLRGRSMSGYVHFPPIAVEAKTLHLTGEIEERPEGYAGPNLAPTGVRMVPLPLDEGVFALLA